MSEELWNAVDANGSFAPRPAGFGVGSPDGAGGGAEGRRRRPGAEPPAPPPPSGSAPRPPLAGRGPKPGASLARLPSTETHFTPEQRLLVLDAWRRSGLPAGDFAPLVGVSKH